MTLYEAGKFDVAVIGAGHAGEALWFYAVTAAAVGTIAVHRLQKRAAIRHASAGGTSPAA